MRRIDALLADYASSHRTRGNRICHAFGITLIVYGGVSMLLALPLPRAPWTAAEVLIAIISLVYVSWSIPLAAAMLAEFAALDLIARAARDWRLGAAAFVIGWIFQAVGHARFERNRPAFFRSLVHLLIGPLFLWNEALHARPAARTTPSGTR